MTMSAWLWLIPFFLLRVTQGNGMYRLSEAENEKLQRTCGQTRPETTDGVFKVFGGVQAKQGEHPWAIVIHTLNDFEDSLIVCSATLVSPRHVITAAHCFLRSLIESSNISTTVAVFGGTTCYNCSAHKGYKPGRMLLPKTVVMPSNADAFLYPVHEDLMNTSADFAILELAEPVEADDIRPMCLPDPYKPLPKNLTVYGFGMTEAKSIVTGMLRTFNIAVTEDDCKPISPGKSELKARQNGTLNRENLERRFGCRSRFGARFKSAQQQQSICDSDSGGAVTAMTDGRQILYGIVSGGDSFCDVGRAPTEISQTFSRVSYHHDFLCKQAGICPVGYNKYFDAPDEGIVLGSPSLRGVPQNASNPLHKILSLLRLRL